MSGRTLLAGLGASTGSAAVLILAGFLLRRCFGGRVPRRVFCLLWDMAVVRMLILTALPSPVSIWRRFPAAALSPLWEPTAPTQLPVGEGSLAEGPLAPAALQTAGKTLPEAGDLLLLLWLAGALGLGAWFLWNHGRSLRLYADALPCRDAAAAAWLTRRPLRRRVQLRWSDRLASPLTYGVLRPVILLPRGMEGLDRAALESILEHEREHIRHFDTLRKGLLATALSLHWLNPAAWLLYSLHNRDTELSCDEAVLRHGADWKSYAMTLLDMEEQRSRCCPTTGHFSQNPLEERIQTMMKPKRISAAALIAVAVLMSLTVTVFAAAPQKGREQAPPAARRYAERITGTEETALLARGDGDEVFYSVDGGETWMSEADYHREYGSDWQVEWWTAEDYEQWLEEEKERLPELIGERGYTGSEGWFIWDQRRVDETIALYEGILEDIRQGALYSRTITDKEGDAVTEVALGSGTADAGAVFATEQEEISAVYEGVAADIQRYSEAIREAGQTAAARHHSEGRHALGDTLAEGSEEPAGTSLEEFFERYGAYGLRYAPTEPGLCCLYWNGEAVEAFVDLQPDGGVYSLCANPGAGTGLRVYTCYDAAGRLTGLRAE